MSCAALIGRMRYAEIVTWARKRYAEGYSLCISRGEIFSRYSRIEDATAVKYLGMRRYIDADGRRIVYR